MPLWSSRTTKLIPALKLGAAGGISVYSNLFPQKMSQLYRLYVNGNKRLAEKTQRSQLPQYKALFWEVNPIPVKYLASEMGLCQAEYRLPLCPPAPECRRRLKDDFGTKSEKNS